MRPEDLKLAVREKYGQIASQSKLQNEQSCCGATCGCSGTSYTIFSESYDNQEGYNPDADLGLGCGIPTQFAAIEEGNYVLDLGSGAGNDCFVARSLVGETGKVTGIDFTDEMLAKASKNLEKMGFTNVNFVKGDIEDMPLPDSSFDVVLSNCVLNLVPSKSKAFAEIMRVLKPGGHFCVSDVVTKGELPAALKKEVEMYAGCVAGAIDINSYLEIVEKQGFVSVCLHKQKEVDISDDLLLHYLSDAELSSFRESEVGIYSITLSGYKPLI